MPNPPRPCLKDYYNLDHSEHRMTTVEAAVEAAVARGAPLKQVLQGDPQKQVARAYSAGRPPAALLKQVALLRKVEHLLLVSAPI